MSQWAKGLWSISDFGVHLVRESTGRERLSERSVYVFVLMPILALAVVLSLIPYITGSYRFSPPSLSFGGTVAHAAVVTGNRETILQTGVLDQPEVTLTGAHSAISMDQQPVSNVITHVVNEGETLIGILRPYCREKDSVVIARDNNLKDANRIYARKTVLTFTNGCPSAPSVTALQSDSPKEQAIQGSASSGNRISKAEARALPRNGSATAEVLPVVVANRDRTRSEVTSLTTACNDLEAVAPRGLPFNERSRLLQLCLIKQGNLHHAMALKRAKHLLVASLPRPESMVNCAAVAKENLRSWVECVQMHYGDIIRSAVERERLDVNIALALMFVESTGNPHAISPSWCLSLMQILPSTAEKFGVDLEQIFDPKVNIETGLRIFRSYLAIARGNLEYAVASYNLGPGEVRNRVNAGFDPNTLPYVQRMKGVLRLIRGINGQGMHRV